LRAWGKGCADAEYATYRKILLEIRFLMYVTEDISPLKRITYKNE
jgi:hypothetical protein